MVRLSMEELIVFRGIDFEARETILVKIDNKEKINNVYW